MQIGTVSNQPRLAQSPCGGCHGSVKHQFPNTYSLGPYYVLGAGGPRMMGSSFRMGSSSRSCCGNLDSSSLRLANQAITLVGAPPAGRSYQQCQLSAALAEILLPVQVGVSLGFSLTAPLEHSSILTWPRFSVCCFPSVAAASLSYSALYSWPRLRSISPLRWRKERAVGKRIKV